MIFSSRRSAKGKSTSNEYRITIVTINDIQANNVAHNDNQVSNSGTNKRNGDLHNLHYPLMNPQSKMQTQLLEISGLRPPILGQKNTKRLTRSKPEHARLVRSEQTTIDAWAENSRITGW